MEEEDVIPGEELLKVEVHKKNLRQIVKSADGDLSSWFGLRQAPDPSSNVPKVLNNKFSK